MPEPASDRFDDLIKNYATILPKLRDKFGRSNCPLTAEAVWQYLNTGKIKPARVMLPGDTKMVQCSASEPTSVAKIRRDLKRAGHGAHAVVTANANREKEHSFNVVNVRETIYLVDAYNQQAVLTKDLEGSLRYAKTLEISRRWDIHIVPADANISYVCH